MAKTLNGRPSQIGSLYFEDNGGYRIRKYSVGYCQCGKKIGLTADEIKEFEMNSYRILPNLIKRLLHIKILVP